MPARLLLACPATSYRLAAHATAARALGVRLSVATDLPAEARQLGCAHHRVDFADVPGSLETLRGEVERPFDGVLAVDERSAMLAAACGADPALSRRPYHTPSAVEAARDKRIMRARLAQAGVPVPKFAFVRPGEPLPHGVVFPCVVKPPMLSGSQGVIRANDVHELAAARVKIGAIVERHPSELSRCAGFFDLLIERYIDGEEVAVEGLVQDGTLEVLCIFDKPDALEGPFFEETIYVTPSRKPAGVVERVVETTDRAARALGLLQGPVHAELRIERSSGTPVLIEIAARSIGGLCSRALERVVGSLEELSIAAALGLPPPPRVDPRPSGVMMIPVPRSGVLRAVEGLDSARAVPGIDAVELAVAPGQAVRTLPEGDRYLGFLFAHGDTPAEVEATLRRAHGRLRFDLKPLLSLV